MELDGTLLQQSTSVMSRLQGKGTKIAAGDSVVKKEEESCRIRKLPRIPDH